MSAPEHMVRLREQNFGRQYDRIFREFQELEAALSDCTRRACWVFAHEHHSFPASD